MLTKDIVTGGFSGRLASRAPSLRRRSEADFRKGAIGERTEEGQAGDDGRTLRGCTDKAKWRRKNNWETGKGIPSNL